MWLIMPPPFQSSWILSLVFVEGNICAWPTYLDIYIRFLTFVRRQAVSAREYAKAVDQFHFI